MAGIVVFGGTLEGRLLAEAFSGERPVLHICVATEYGERLLPEGENIHIHRGRMAKEEMVVFLQRIMPDFCMDATHPYAEAATKNIRQACKSVNLTYIRILREEEDFYSNGGKGIADNLIHVNSIEEAAHCLDGTSGNILITTGSKELEKYTAISGYRERCYARVLPTVPVMEKCRALGFEGKNLIGMQGPFSKELNAAMIRQIGAAWMVTKDSGREGGYAEKCQAAVCAGIKLVVVGRPSPGEENTMSLAGAVRYISEYYGRESDGEKTKHTQRIYIVGMGPGSARCVTEEAWNCIRESDCLIGAERVLAICRGAETMNLHMEKKVVFTGYKREDIASFLHKNRFKNIALLYSGDIGFYSGAKGMKSYLQENFSEYEIKTISGISSPAYFLNKRGVPWEDTALVSIHGKKENLIWAIRTNLRVCALLGTGEDISHICGSLENHSMNHIRVTVGEKLSYQEEQIRTGYPCEWVGKKTEALAVALFENPKPESMPLMPGLADDNFVRGRVPMTKREIRILSLAKLGLRADSVLYDIGAGTGSVSVEAARLLHRGSVFAVERNPEGIRLIRENINRFQLSNVTIIEGTAPECLREGIFPEAVFIGGSGGKIMEIVGFFRKTNPKVRFVINAVTIETLTEINNIRREYPEYKNMEMEQVSIARSREAGEYHMMLSENPVFIIAFGGKEAGGER